MKSARSVCILSFLNTVFSDHNQLRVIAAVGIVDPSISKGDTAALDGIVTVAIVDTVIVPVVVDEIATGGTFIRKGDPVAFDGTVTGGIVDPFIPKGDTTAFDGIVTGGIRSGEQAALYRNGGHVAVIFKDLCVN